MFGPGSDHTCIKYEPEKRGVLKNRVPVSARRTPPEVAGAAKTSPNGALVPGGRKAASAEAASATMAKLSASAASAGRLSISTPHAMDDCRGRVITLSRSEEC